MKTILFALLISTVAVGCKNKETTGGSSDNKATEAPAGALPALTAEPDPGTITAAETPPLDAVKFRMLAKRGKGGWPTFEAYNHGTKPIGFMALYGYAYDKDGKQLARTKVPLSWNGKIDPGGKTDWSIDLGADDVPVTAAATTFQLCYTSVKAVGDADMTTDDKRCPDQRAKK